MELESEQTLELEQECEETLKIELELELECEQTLKLKLEQEWAVDMEHRTLKYRN